MEVSGERPLTEKHGILTAEHAEQEALLRTLDEKIYQEIHSPNRSEKRLADLYKEQGKVGEAWAKTEENLRKIRLQAAKNKIVLTTSLSRVLDVEDIAKIAEHVKSAPENIRTLWNMAEARMRILNKNFRGTSHYDSWERGIKYDATDDRFGYGQKPYKTLFHELGHLLDHHYMGHGMYFNSYIYRGHLFRETLLSEADLAVKKELGRLKAQAVGNGTSARNIKIGDAQKSLSKALERLPSLERREVSDIFSGATKNKVTGGYKHETKYWRDERTLPSEAFAHMFEATILNSEALSHIKEYFPKSYEQFEAMIDEWLKEDAARWIGKSLTDYFQSMMKSLRRGWRQSKCHLAISTTR